VLALLAAFVAGLHGATAPRTVRASGVTITGVSPNSCMNYGGGTITVSGSGFVNAFGNDAPTSWIDGILDFDVTFVDSNTLTIICPADLGKVGPVSLKISNGDGSGQAQVDNLLRYTPGPLNFKQAANSPLTSVGGRPILVDFNHDNKVDEVKRGGSGVIVALGNGDGTFGTTHTYPSSNRDIAVGDFNGDGNVDIAVADDNETGTVSILLGNGDGSFGSPISFSVGSSADFGDGAWPFAIVVGDFNKDNKPDIAIGDDTAAGDVSVLLNTTPANGTLSFATAAVYKVNPYPESIAVGDLNNDGYLDILTGDPDGFNDNVYVLMNNKNGTFTGKGVEANGGQAISEIAVGDVDGDGKADLVVTQAISENTLFFRGNGDGTFSSGPQIGVGFSGDDVVLVDLDGDGKLDLVTSGQYHVPYTAEFDQTIAMFHNSSSQGTISFDQPARYVVGTQLFSPGLVGTGDLNGDGRKDIVVASGPVFLNTSGKATTTTISAQPNGQVGTGQQVTFTATVSGAGGTPTGTVQFLDGITSLGSPASLSGGHASFSTSSLSTGTHDIYAVYSGDTTFGAGTSGPFQQDIVQLDNTAPTTTAAVTSGTAGSNGWYTSSSVTVTLTAQDEAGGSGVATTYFKVDSANCTPASTGSCSTGTSVDVSGDGQHTVYFFSVDTAGNKESQKSFAVKLDHTSPTTSAAVTSGTAGSGGWYTSSSVTVTLSPTDGSGASGVATTYYKLDDASCVPANLAACSTGTAVTVSSDGQHTVSFFSIDNGGNKETQKTFMVKLDHTLPTTTAAVTSGTAGSNGWYTSSSVTVTLSPADGSGGSGLASTYYAVGNAACAPANTAACSTGTTVGISGDGQHTVYYFSTDTAGNKEAQQTFAVKLDHTAPTVAVTGVSDGGTYPYGSVPTAGCQTSDATSSAQTNAALTLDQLTGAPAHTGTFKATCSGATDQAGNSAAAVTAQYTVQPVPLTITAQDQSRAFGAPNPTCQVSGDGFVSGDSPAVLSGTLACDFGGATTSSPAGDYPNTPSGLSSGDYTLSFHAGTLHVGQQATSLSVASPSSVQYSDQVTLTATVGGYSAGGASGGGSVSFAVNGVAVCGASGQPACPTPDPSGVATVNVAELALGPRSMPYSVQTLYTPANRNFTGSGPASAATGLTVTAEDARVSYSGAPFVAPTAPSGTSVSVLLSATVRDISAVSGDPATDAYPGDIRTATLTFVDRGHGNAVLCTPSLTLVTAADSKTATASCSTSVSLGTQPSATLQVGLVVGGNYSRNSAADTVTIAIGRPRSGASAYASGALASSPAAGSLLGSAPSCTLTVQLLAAYTAGATTPTGTLVVQVRAGGQTYTVTASSLTLLVESGRQAVVQGTATIMNTTSVGHAVLVESNATIQVQLTGTGPNTGSVAVQVWRADGSLAVASGWDGAKPVEQPLPGTVVVS
jgi:hypothetical protein